MTQHTYGWEAITPHRRPRNERAEAEQAIWKLQNQIWSWMEDGNAPDYLSASHYHDVTSVLIGAVFTCRTGDLAGAAQMIAALAIETGSSIRDHWTTELHHLALAVSGETDDYHQDDVDQNSLRHGD